MAPVSRINTPPLPLPGPSSVAGGAAPVPLSPPRDVYGEITPQARQDWQQALLALPRVPSPQHYPADDYWWILNRGPYGRYEEVMDILHREVDDAPQHGVQVGIQQQGSPSSPFIMGFFGAGAAFADGPLSALPLYDMMGGFDGGYEENLPPRRPPSPETYRTEVGDPYYHRGDLQVRQECIDDALRDNPDHTLAGKVLREKLRIWGYLPAPPEGTRRP